MIKLLVCDVDGTLLTGEASRISDDVIKLLCGIYDKNIKLAIASGRSYTDLCELFAEISDKLYFICHDGALCMNQGKVLYRKSVTGESIAQFASQYSGRYKCTAFYGMDKCYVIGSQLPAAGKNTVIIKKPYEIKEQIYKLAVYDDESTDINTIPASVHGLRICSHAGGCLEYVSSFANKGAALCDLQNRLFLTKFDTAAIGNDVNDIKMFRNAKYSASLSPYGSEAAQAAEYKVTGAEEFLTMVLHS